MIRRENGTDGLSRGPLRSHLAVSDEDPDLGSMFSTERLMAGDQGLRNVPASVHGAPETLQESRETLLRLKRMAGFESQNFDPIDNDVEREFQIHRSERDYALAEFWKWFLAFLIGVCMGVLGFCVDWGIGRLNDAKFKTVQLEILSSRSFLGPYFMYVFISMGYASVAGALVSFVEPLAAGSGIPEIKTYLNGIHIKGLLAVRTLVAKLTGVIFTIAAGMIAGKEGPFVHGGGIVGGGLGAMGSQTITDLLRGRVKARAPRSWGGYFRNDADHRDFTAIGTAAGVATAFAAPIGGLLFMVEEGASFYSHSIFWRGFLSTCIGVLTLHFLVECAESTNVLQAHFGRYRDFGLYTDSLGLYGSRMFYYVWDLPIFCVMGAIGGALGALFIHLNVKVTKLRHRYIPVRTSWRRLGEVIALIFITSSIFFLITYTSKCKPLPDKAQLEYFEAIDGEEPYERNSEDLYAGGGQYRRAVERTPIEHFPQLWCNNGSYSVYGQIFFTPMSQALRLIIHLGEPLPEDELAEFTFDLGLLLTFFVVAFTLMTFTNGVGASTGMFVPSLAVGAAGGRICGQIVRGLVRWAVGDQVKVSLTSYAVIGAAAYMGGSTRMTLTSVVMVMETTGALQLIVPIMLTVFFAKVVGDCFGHGIDDTHIKIRGAPVLDEPALESHQKMIADKLTVSELMTMAIVALPPVVKVRQLVETLRCCAHEAFPVTPDVKRAFETAEAFDLQGIILRDAVLKLLQHHFGFLHSDLAGELPSAKSHIPTTQKERLHLLEMLEQRPLKLRPKDEQERVIRSLSPTDMDMLVDLRPFMQRNPHVVQADASLSRAYRLFRTMGLRHLFVGPPQPQVFGLITRKDIAEANAKLALGRKANLGLTTPSAHLVRRDSLPFIPYGAYDPTVGGYPASAQGASSMGIIAEEEAGVNVNGRTPPNLELTPQRVDLTKDLESRDSLSPTALRSLAGQVDGRRRARQRSQGPARDSLDDADSLPLLDEQNP